MSTLGHNDMLHTCWEVNSAKNIKPFYIESYHSSGWKNPTSFPRFPGEWERWHICTIQSTSHEFPRSSNKSQSTTRCRKIHIQIWNKLAIGSTAMKQQWTRHTHTHTQHTTSMWYGHSHGNNSLSTDGSLSTEDARTAFAIRITNFVKTKKTVTTRFTPLCKSVQNCTIQTHDQNLALGIWQASEPSSWE